MASIIFISRPIPMQPYSSEVEQLMQQFYQSLSEKDRRRLSSG